MLDQPAGPAGRMTDAGGVSSLRTLASPRRWPTLQSALPAWSARSARSAQSAALQLRLKRSLHGQPRDGGSGSGGGSAHTLLMRSNRAHALDA
eukprot:157378-Chlamydomonas_euryale.AAC.1